MVLVQINAIGAHGRIMWSINPTATAQREEMPLFFIHWNIFIIPLTTGRTNEIIYNEIIETCGPYALRNVEISSLVDFLYRKNP